VGGGHTWQARGVRAYNGGLGAEPAVGSRGRAPGQSQETKTGKSGVDMSTPVHPMATPLRRGSRILQRRVSNPSERGTGGRGGCVWISYIKMVSFNAIPEIFIISAK